MRFSARRAERGPLRPTGIPPLVIVVVVGILRVVWAQTANQDANSNANANPALSPQCSFDVRYAVTDLSSKDSSDGPTSASAEPTSASASYDAVMTVTSNRDESAPLQIVYTFAESEPPLELAYVNNAVIVTKGNETLGVPTRLKTLRAYRRGQRAEITSGVVAEGGFSKESRLGLEELNVNGIRCEPKGRGGGGGGMGYEACMNAISFFTSFNGRPPPTGGADACAMEFCCGVVPVVVEQPAVGEQAGAGEQAAAVGEQADAGPGDAAAVEKADAGLGDAAAVDDGNASATSTLPSSETPRSGNSGVLIGVVVGVAVVLLIVVFASCVVIRRRRRMNGRGLANDDHVDSEDSRMSTPRKQLSLKSTASGISTRSTSPFSTPTNRISLAASTVGVNSHHLATQGSLCMSTQHTHRNGLPTPIDHLPDDLPEDVILHEKLGAGAFGTVFKGEWGGHTVAVKVLQTAYASNSREMDSFRQEIAVLSGLRHPNIVAFLAACTIPPDICIVEELAEGGSLHSKLHGTSGDENRCRPMPAGKVVQVAIDVARAMVYLHPNIVHRDLKSQNVLLDADGRAKVCDFGIAKFKDRTFVSTVNGQAGTPAYMAPELFDGLNATEKVDVYSFAILLWECLTGKVPWGHVPSPMQIIYYVGVLNQRPALPADGSVPADLERLIQDCWVVDPTKRPGFDSILERLQGMQKEDWATVESRPVSPMAEAALAEEIDDDDEEGREQQQQQEECDEEECEEEAIQDERDDDGKPSTVAPRVVEVEARASLVDRVKSFSIL